MMAAGGSGSASSSLEVPLSSTSESKSDIDKVMERLLDVKRKTKLEAQKNTLEECIRILNEHSCAGGPQHRHPAESVPAYSNVPPNSLQDEGNMSDTSDPVWPEQIFGQLVKQIDSEASKRKSSSQSGEDDSIVFKRSGEENEGDQSEEHEVTASLINEETSPKATGHTNKLVPGSIPRIPPASSVNGPPSDVPRRKLSKEEAKQFQQDSMKTTVAEIYDIDCNSSQKNLVIEKYSFQMVVGAMVKVICMADPEDADAETSQCIYWFLESCEGADKEAFPSADVIAGMRTCIAHGHVCQVDDGNYVLYNVIMCKRAQKKVEYTEVFKGTRDQFVALSSRLRKLFLSWKEVKPYLPQSDLKEAEEERQH